jgi:hypothetical protein
MPSVPIGWKDALSHPISLGIETPPNSCVGTYFQVSILMGGYILFYSVTNIYEKIQTYLSFDCEVSGMFHLLMDLLFIPCLYENLGLSGIYQKYRRPEVCPKNSMSDQRHAL